MRSNFLSSVGNFIFLAVLILSVSGCGGSASYSSGGNSTPQTPEYLYALGPYDIQVFNIDFASGHLNPVQTVNTSGLLYGNPPNVTTTPANFLYYESAQGVDAYTIDSEGSLTLISGSPFQWPSLSQDVATLVINPNNMALYGVSSSSDTVLGFQIDSATEALTAMPGDFNIGTNAESQLYGEVIDPSGKFTYVTDWYASLSIFPTPAGIEELSIDPSSGYLTPLSNSPFLLPFNSDPWQIVTDPTGKFVYVSSAEGDGVFGFTRDLTTGELTEMSESPFNIDVGTAGDGIPMEIHPSGKFLYASNYDGSFSGYTIDPVSGNLSLITGSPFPGQAPIGGCLYVSPCGAQSQLLIDPSGEYAYSPDYFNSNDGPAIAIYKVNQSTGALSNASGSPEATTEDLIDFNIAQVQ